VKPKCRKQVLAQACAICSPESGSMSEMAIRHYVPGLAPLVTDTDWNVFDLARLTHNLFTRKSLQISRLLLERWPQG